MQPNWSREKITKFWDPGKQLLRSIRKYQFWRSKKIFGRLISKYHVLCYRFWTAVSGAQIPINCNIGGGLLIPHPSGIVLHPDVTIGNNCIIMSGVVIGTKEGVRGVPSIGDCADIGSGAKILGDIKIGSNVKVGANAVVLIDVLDGKTIVGVPGKVL